MVADLLPERCVILSPVARDKWGTPTSTNEVRSEVNCFFDKRGRAVRGTLGEEILSAGRFLLPLGVQITVDHRIEFEGREYEPVIIDEPGLLEGPSLVVVEVS